jgi:hypothetical protein
MKQLSSITIIAALLVSLNSLSQNGVQIGAQGVFSKTKGWGAEVVGNIQAAKNFSVGIGIRPIKFEEHGKLYLPVFVTAKYYYPLPKYTLFASLDPGYGIYPSEYVSDGPFSFYRKGAVYLSGSVSITGNSKLAPYASIHFTKFGFKEYYGSSSQYRPISTFTFTAGIILNRSAEENIFFQRKKSVAGQEKTIKIQTQDDYLKKSKHQRTAGHILLGTGIALIGGSIILAAQKDDPFYKALSLTVMGGPGVISSLTSIPFFIASVRNKRKAMKF